MTHATKSWWMGILLLAALPLDSHAITLSTSGDPSTQPGASQYLNYDIDPNAPAMAPIGDTLLSLTGDSELRYDWISIPVGTSVSIDAPVDSQVHFIANGDINILGSLDWLQGPLLLTSISGTILIQGTLTAQSIALNAGTVLLQDSASFVVSGNQGTRDGAIDPGNLQISQAPVPAAIWLFGSGLAGLFAAGRRGKA